MREGGRAGPGSAPRGDRAGGAGRGGRDVRGALRDGGVRGRGGEAARSADERQQGTRTGQVEGDGGGGVGGLDQSRVGAGDDQREPVPGGHDVVGGAQGDGGRVGPARDERTPVPRGRGVPEVGPAAAHHGVGDVGGVGRGVAEAGAVARRALAPARARGQVGDALLGAQEVPDGVRPEVDQDRGEVGAGGRGGRGEGDRAAAGQPQVAGEGAGGEDGPGGARGVRAGGPVLLPLLGRVGEGRRAAGRGRAEPQGAQARGGAGPQAQPGRSGAGGGQERSVVQWSGERSTSAPGSRSTPLRTPSR